MLSIGGEGVTLHARRRLSMARPHLTLINAVQYTAARDALLQACYAILSVRPSVCEFFRPFCCSNLNLLAHYHQRTHFIFNQCLMLFIIIIFLFLVPLVVKIPRVKRYKMS